jgi:hypothetical protein
MLLSARIVVSCTLVDQKLLPSCCSVSSITVPDPSHWAQPFTMLFCLPTWMPRPPGDPGCFFALSRDASRGHVARHIRNRQTLWPCQTFTARQKCVSVASRGTSRFAGLVPAYEHVFCAAPADAPCGIQGSVSSPKRMVSQRRDRRLSFKVTAERVCRIVS